MLAKLAPLALCLALLVPAAAPAAVEITTTGLSYPFFDDAGRITHKLNAKRATKAGDLQQLREVEVEYFAPGEPSRVVQRIVASEATWNLKTETLEGRGSIVVETEEDRLAGEGFLFEMPRAQLNIRCDFSMANREVLLTSDRAVVDLVLERDKAKDADVKVRDVKRCEAFGNLRIKVLPTAKQTYEFDELFSSRAIYDGASHTITIPEETRVLKKGRPATARGETTIKLDDATRPAKRLAN